MKQSNNNSYKNSGVDVEAGYESNKLIAPLIEQTKIPGVLKHLNNFAGFFELNSSFKNPVLVSGTDGVGTKLKIAQVLNKHSTIGVDCVAMCANDVVCSGAKPLFFLDYIACGKNQPEKTQQIVSGIADGCLKTKMALIGGETAEHPKIMAEDDYDLAGFCVGLVEKSNILPKQTEQVGDLLIGLASSGVHSNGFSLIRQIFNPETTDFDSNCSILEKSLGETLLEPTEIYVQPILSLLNQVEVKAICHITGGGFFENIPRILQKNLNAVIYEKEIKTPKIFDLISSKGNISKQEMFSTFNMGVGMVCVIDKNHAHKAISTLNSSGVLAYTIGELIAGTGQIEFA